jgi:topoisomerase-4 subunit A
MSGSDLASDGNGAQEAQFADILQERYLAYAMSTIMSRSLPDVRDGLKPVHRRLLYTMRELKLNPSSAFKKCAKIVGDTTMPWCAWRSPLPCVIRWSTGRAISAISTAIRRRPIVIPRRA